MSDDIEAIIFEKLTTALKPEVLKIVDESEKHHGHAGAIPGKRTHFRVKVVSKKFEGLTPLERHRLVYQILENELKTQVHALTLTALDRHH